MVFRVRCKATDGPHPGSQFDRARGEFELMQGDVVVTRKVLWNMIDSIIGLPGGTRVELPQPHRPVRW